jgi:P-type conjugative transfer protein TrbL
MTGIIMAAVILIILALISINMVLLLVSGWILAYAGIFFLGFGGSRWTSEIAINYYKTILGVAVSLFAMVLLVGIGNLPRRLLRSHEYGP